jgi:hypothetical protein
MRFGKTTITMISILTFCCACNIHQVSSTVTPTRIAPEITVPAGKDFDCWDAKASGVSTENMKQENLLIFSNFWENENPHSSA